VRNVGYVFSERGGVDCVSEREERRQPLERFVVEAIEVSEVARLVDLVNVCLLRGELDVFEDLGPDFAQESVVDKGGDNAVLVTV
jgi:hypothetical protein